MDTSNTVNQKEAGFSIDIANGLDRLHILAFASSLRASEERIPVQHTNCITSDCGSTNSTHTASQSPPAHAQTASRHEKSTTAIERPTRKLAPSFYQEMRNGIWCILLSAQDDKGMDGYTVTAELRRSLDTTITDYYDGIATSSKGSRSVKGFVDDELSKMRTKGYLSRQGQLTNIGREEAFLVLGLKEPLM